MQHVLVLQHEVLYFLHAKEVWYLHLPIHFHYIGPCLLLCFLQSGVTPVMLAAGKGHTGVVDLLVHKYNCSLTEVTTVSAFDVLGCQSPVGVSYQCLCRAFSVECHSACSQHLCRMYGRRK